MTNDDLFKQLKHALRDRLAVIGDCETRERDPAEHRARLQSVSEKIVRLQTQLPDNINPQLEHFLKRCSYDKALAFLESM